MVAVTSTPVSTWHVLIGCPPSNLVLLQRDSIAEDALPTALRGRALAAATRGAPAPPSTGCAWDPAQWPGLEVDPGMLQPLVSLDGMACKGVPCAMMQGPLGLAPPQGGPCAAPTAAVQHHQLAAWSRTTTVTSGGQVLVVAPLHEKQDVEAVQAVLAGNAATNAEAGGSLFCHRDMLSNATYVPAHAVQRVCVRMSELACSVL